MADSLPSLRETVEKHGLMAQKALGQNFLLDSNITDKIIRLSLERQGLNDFSGTYVFEVGPGPGGLTRSILQQNPEKLTVIEMDPRCMAIMEELKAAGYANLDIINHDALKIDFCRFPGRPKQIISNLPYNISVPLLVGWLKQMPEYAALTLMFQKEVAARITAKPHSKDYGRISVLSQLICRMDSLLELNPQCFVPAPKIWSEVLLFQPLSNRPDARQIANLERLTTLAFGQRRKMLRQSLKSLPDFAAKAEAAGIDTSLRAEDLTPSQYLKLADLL